MGEVYHGHHCGGLKPIFLVLFYATFLYFSISVRVGVALTAMDLSFLPIFLTTLFVATITPGPSMLLALNHGICFGWRRSLATAWGNVAATALQCLVSFLGLGYVLAKAAWLLSTIRWAGAAYLVYLGLRLLFGPVSLLAAEAKSESSKPGRSLFREAFMVTASNPKAVCFFSSLFPQFFADGQLSLGKAAVMFWSTLTMTFTCMLLYATAGARIQGLLRSARFRAVFQRGVGTALVGFGAGLALDRR
jgi:threonine/homoserine/homoserine lactone efflux protein